MNHLLFDKNMYFAREALKHVKTIFQFGSINHYDDQATITQRKRDTLDQNRKLAEQDVILRRGKFGSLSKFEAYSLFATLRAEQSGIGNCHEQTYSAYRFLAPQIRPLDIFNMRDTNIRKTNVNSDGDHVFLIVGLQVKTSMNLLPLHEVALWNKEAVICDAWNNDVYPAYMYTVRAVCGGGWHLLEELYHLS